MRLTTFLVTTAAVAALAGAAFAQPPGGGRPGMTPEERAAAFDKADANKDGKLDKTEFAASLPEQAQAMADQIFPRRDTNMDGFISKEEFMTPPAGRGGGGRPG
jgi:hypothetical protein